MKAYSLDLRAKVVEALEAGRGTQREIAEMFDVSRTFVQNMVRSKRDRGTLEPKPHRRGPQPTIRAEHEEIIRDFIRGQNDATLDEAREHLAKVAGVSVSHPTMSRALSRLGLGRKKKSHPG